MILILRNGVSQQEIDAVLERLESLGVKGHLARGVKTIYPRIIDCYYQGREPVYLDPQAPLTLPELSELSAQYCEQSKQISEDLQKAPTPEEVIDTLSELART